MIAQETSDPRLALAWIREGRKYDMALLDMQMPEMDGVTLRQFYTPLCWVYLAHK
jgi:CheY-like chemotaxis protein